MHDFREITSISVPLAVSEDGQPLEILHTRYATQTGDLNRYGPNGGKTPTLFVAKAEGKERMVASWTHGGEPEIRLYKPNAPVERYQIPEKGMGSPRWVEGEVVRGLESGTLHHEHAAALLLNTAGAIENLESKPNGWKAAITELESFATKALGTGGLKPNVEKFLSEIRPSALRTIGRL